MPDPYVQLSTRATPQSEPIPGSIPNSAGGYAFALDDWARLRRFLILGSEGGTYYIGERELTKENYDALQRLIAGGDGVRVVEEIKAISVAGRNPRQQPVMFALAYCAGSDDPGTRAAALAALPTVARTGTMLFLFVRYVEQFRGWGRGLRKAIAGWYTSQAPDQLAYQLVKYRQREGWSHRDLLRLSKPRPTRGSTTDGVLAWAVGKGTNDWHTPQLLRVVDMLGEVHPARAIELIEQHRLPWEVVPSEQLADARTWHALLPGLPLGALVRNLGRMTANGALKPLSGFEATVVSKLTDPIAIPRSRIHPLGVLLATTTYARGRGDRGKLDWTPSAAVVDALGRTFRMAFANVVPANKRTLIGLDVSGSMDGSMIAGSNLSAREGSSAMCIVTAASEPQCQVIAFSDNLMTLPITGSSSLAEVVNMTRRLPFRGTDCAVPMLYAIQNQLEVDTFVVYTDSETWAGAIHPSQAIQEYRRRSGIPARLVVVGMTSNRFTIADPNDAGMLDVVGFDSAAPALIADFSAGRM